MAATSATQYGLKRSATPLWLRICPGRPCCLLQCYIPKGTTKQSTTEKVLAEPFDKQIISFLYTGLEGDGFFIHPRTAYVLWRVLYPLCTLLCPVARAVCTSLDYRREVTWWRPPPVCQAPGQSRPVCQPPGQSAPARHHPR